MNHVIMQNRRRGWLRGLAGGPGRRARHGLKPDVLALEDRRLMASFAVTNINPSGSGSLAAAVALANSTPGANTIDFDSTALGVDPKITLASGPLVLSNTSGMQTIMGPAAGVTISGGGNSGVFQVNDDVTATLSGLTITEGSTKYGGGVFNDGAVTLSNCTISGNSAIAGGGVYNLGTAQLTNCYFSKNPVIDDGGGVLNLGTATLTNCTFSGNSAGNGGGGVANAHERVQNAGVAVLTNCTFSGNNGGNFGGAVYDRGLGALNASAQLYNCTVSDNFALIGGGVYNNQGTATLADCTVTGNSAGEIGGGVFNAGSAALTNCTLSGNSATESGGGVANENFVGTATAALTNCTISGNSAHDGGGVYNGRTATLTDTIVAGNTEPSSAASDIINSGTVTGSYNLIGTGGSGGLMGGQDGNIVLTSLTGLGLAPLGNYGGPTQTMALVPGSLAIKAGLIADYPGTSTPITTDQRGFALDSPGPDIGAFQSQPSSSELVVNSTADGSGDQPGTLDLRGAVDLANVLTGARTITFAPTVFATAQTIVLTAGPLVLSQTSGLEKITGPPAGVTVSGGGASSVFEIDPGVTATLSGLTITGGSASGFGGGVYANNAALLTLMDCTISGNSAEFGGGLLMNKGKASLSDCAITGNAASVKGGGLNNYGGAATIEDCTIAGNTAIAGGGGIFAGLNHSQQPTTVLIEATISDNYADSGVGGLHNEGTATLTDTIVAGNTEAPFAASDISGTVTGSHNLIGTGGSGGLESGQNGNIVLTSLTDLGLAPLGNYGGPTQTMALLPGSEAIGKGIAVSGVTTDQRGFSLDSPIDIGAFQFHSSYSLVVKTTSDSGAPTGEFDLRGAVDLANVLTGAQTITFDPTVFAKAQTILLTAGPLEVSQTSGPETITGPAAGVTISGGGTSGVLLVDGGVTATLSDLTLTGGSAGDGAGLDNFGKATLTNCTLSGNVATYFGGGVFDEGTATLINCTLSGNSAEFGGGVDNFLSSTAILSNCTISTNSGGGVFNDGDATAALSNCTISGNSGFGVANYGAATLTDTIVAGNIASSSAASDITGTDSVTGSHNLIGTGGSGGLEGGQDGNIVLTSLTGLGLAPLGFYGGPTKTMALLPGSAAIGNGVAVSGITTDQRGFALDSPNPDIGAFQSQPSSSELVVNSTADGSGDQPGTLDLRGAVDLADVLTGAQTVTFDPTVFAKAETIVLTAGPLELSQISGQETITGPAARVTISGGDQSGVFQVSGGVTATLSGLTITDGFSTFGGGINNEGIVTLTNCTISGSSATSIGGGLFNVGTATLTNCTISGNSATQSGGGVDNGGTAYLTKCTISQNSAPYAGGVENTGTAVLTNCTISGNSAQNHGGGMETFGTATLTDCTISKNTAFFGGGVYDSSGTTKLTGCTFSSNTAFTGGGMFNTSSGSMIIDGGTTSGNTANGATGSGGGIFNQGSLSVTESKIAANHSSVYYGGGLENYDGTAMLVDCTFSGNTATRGGGASNFGGSLTANGCTFSGNSASNGGGVYNNGTAPLTNCTISGNSASNGGGVYNNGTATLYGCTLSSNAAVQDGGSSFGGALFDLNKAILTNCTIAGNSAGTSGGGIEAQGTVTVAFSTFTGNQATYGGAIDNDQGHFTVTLEDTILAGDSATTEGPEFCNKVTSAGHNLVADIENSSGWVPSDLIPTGAQPLNPLLAALGKYGGTTETIALLPGSPALGTGIAVSGVTTDQRGVKRPSTGVDIGAFQSQGFTLTPVSGSTPQSALIDTAFASALAVKVTAKDSLEPVAGGVIDFLAPSSGATATLSAATATIGSNGVASVNATANNTGGAYKVTAAPAGAAAAASFALTNVYQPVFSGLTNYTIVFGTSSLTISGTIAAGAQFPTGDDVTVTLNGVAQKALIGATGSFSTIFATAALGVAGSPYTISYVFSAKGVFLGTSGISLLTVNSGG